MSLGADAPTRTSSSASGDVTWLRFPVFAPASDVAACPHESRGGPGPATHRDSRRPAERHVGRDQKAVGSQQKCVFSTTPRSEREAFNRP